MKILGIDPALASLGWGMVEVKPPKINYIASGVLKTNSNVLLYKRLFSLSDAIGKIIDLYQPEVVAMEETFVNINAVSSSKLSYVRGAIMALVGSYDLPYHEYKPNLIKKTVVGSGHAEKHQIEHMLKLIISGTPAFGGADEFDALAVAYTCSVLQNAKKNNFC